ncbi:MAG: flagellar M-ring protein FliF [Pseudomonadales bacterium]|nr:flagellar M-ring protein FliF [Pseudomonadales bacterium]
MADSAVAEEVVKPTTGMMAALEGAGGLSILRQIGLMIGLAASVAIGIAIALWSQESTYRPLYTDISHLEAGQVAELLDQEQIRYKIDTASGMLMVESARIHDARIKLAQEGFPTGKTIGYELLDKEQSFGTSQFMEKARYYRSIEGELARTIASMNRVRNARVHLAVPKRSVFVNDRRRPSASVFIELYNGQSLDKPQVAAIVHLVSSSIPELKESDVTVVDQRGNLLSEQDKDSDIAMAAKQFEYTQKIEDRLSMRISNILEPIVGPEGYTVQVAADIDFSIKEQTAESFNPELPAMRSEQTLNEFAGSGGANGIPGALSNQPPGAVTVPEQAGAAGGAAEGGQSGNVRRQATRNYELDRTISHTRHQVGNIKRLTVAVVLDDKWANVTDENGKSTRAKRPLSDAEIERINMLVRNAIGYSAARGDSLSVVNQPFNQIEEVALEIPPVEWWKETWVLDIARMVGAFILVLLLFFAVLRPIFKSLVSAGSDDVTALAAGLDADGLGGLGETGAMGEGADVTLSGGSNPLLPSPDDSYETQLDSVKGLVAEDPKRVAQVVKTWLKDE